jgi:flagellar hook assembly protein FlgD
VPKAGTVEVRIFDIQGRLIRSLTNLYQQAGSHSIVWDSRGNTGTVVASGTYFCQVLFNGSALVKKLVLIK